MDSKIKCFTCKTCDFNCCKKGDWTRHISTDKHLNRTQYINLEQKSAENDKKFVCKFCQKSYVTLDTGIKIKL